MLRNWGILLDAVCIVYDAVPPGEDLVERGWFSFWVRPFFTPSIKYSVRTIEIIEKGALCKLFIMPFTSFMAL